MKNTIAAALALTAISSAGTAHALCPAGNSLIKVWQLQGVVQGETNLIRIGTLEVQRTTDFQGVPITLTFTWPAACVNGKVYKFAPTPSSVATGYVLDDDLQVCAEGSESVNMSVVTASGYNCGGTRLTAFRYEGFFLHLEGTSGNDLIAGGPGVDFLSGWSGNDALYGVGGNDYLSGFSGNDTLRGGAGNDDLYGDEGVDTITDQSGFDSLYGGGGSEACMSDDDNVWADFDCGSGTEDNADSANQGAISCENEVNYC